MRTSLRSITCLRKPKKLPGPALPVSIAVVTPERRQNSSASMPSDVPPQGNESRLTPQRPQYLQQVFGIPCGAFAAALDGSFVGDLAHQVEGEVADHGHVVGPVTDAQA